MKQIILVALLSLMIMECGADSASPKPEESLSADQVAKQIASLRGLIIPAEGTTRADVDAVFGEPEVTKALIGKGSATMYPMHSYQLLAPERGQVFRTYLYITYRNDKVHFAGMNHACVTKGKRLFRDPPELVLREKDREDRAVLADLLEIKKKYEGKLKDALWNK
jgi:hypothetical protein